MEEASVSFESMSVATKQGDGGQTRLFSGERLSKSEKRINAYGTLDELNSFLGLARSFCENAELNAIVFRYQNKLFRLGAELATSDTSKIKIDPLTEADVEEINKTLDDLERTLTLPPRFIVPGTNKSSALFDVCRTVCRRFERLMVEFFEAGQWKNKNALAFTNRLSDLLFLMARAEDHGERATWKGSR